MLHFSIRTSSFKVTKSPTRTLNHIKDRTVYGLGRSVVLDLTRSSTKNFKYEIDGGHQISCEKGGEGARFRSPPEASTANTEECLQKETP